MFVFTLLALLRLFQGFLLKNLLEGKFCRLLFCVSVAPFWIERRDSAGSLCLLSPLVGFMPCIVANCGV